MSEYESLSEKHGVTEEYDSALRLLNQGRGNSWLVSVTSAIDLAEESGRKINIVYSSYTGNTITEWAGLRYRDF